MPQNPMVVGAEWAKKYWGVEVVDTTPAAPVMRNPPVASLVGAGTGAAGDQIACTVGNWDNVPDTYAYRWSRGGAQIAGALGAAEPYTIVAADSGLELTCILAATNVGGTTFSTPSNPIGAL
jgi:hypothetical protein